MINSKYLVCSRHTIVSFAFGFTDNNSGVIFKFKCISRPTDKQKLPHLDENQDFKAIVSGAQPMWHKSITTFASLRADVFSDLQNIDKVISLSFCYK